MPRLAISLFGLFHVTLDGTPVTEFKTNKGQSPVAYLAVEADRTHECALSPRTSEGSAATNLLHNRLPTKRSHVGNPS